MRLQPRAWRRARDRVRLLAASIGTLLACVRHSSDAYHLGVHPVGIVVYWTDQIWGARHDPPHQDRPIRRSQSREQRASSQDRGSDPRGYCRARRSGCARVLGKIRQVVARILPPFRKRNCRMHTRVAAAGDRRHSIRAGADSQFCIEAAGRLAGRGSGNDSRRCAGPQEYSGEQRRVLRSRRAVSDGRVRAHERGDGQGRRREAHHRERASHRRQAACGHRRGHALWRGGRNLCVRRRASSRRHGPRHRNDRARGHARRAGQRVRCGSEAPAIRARWHRLAGGADRNPYYRGRFVRRRNGRCRFDRTGGARSRAALPFWSPIPQSSRRKFRRRSKNYSRGCRPRRSRGKRGRIAARLLCATRSTKWCRRPIESPPNTCRC